MFDSVQEYLFLNIMSDFYYPSVKSGTYIFYVLNPTLLTVSLNVIKTP